MKSGVDMQSMERVLKNLEKEVNKVYDKTSEGLIAAMVDTLRRAQKLTPVASSGNLRASGYIIWGKSRTPKGGSPSFKDTKFSQPSSAAMASQHSNVMQEKRSMIMSASKGLKPRQGAIGFSAVYAAKTHENPRSGNTGGVSPSGRPYPEGSYAVVGQYKFLETPLKETNRIVRIIKERARK
jgi:hypothetical protein